MSTESPAVPGVPVTRFGVHNLWQRWPAVLGLAITASVLLSGATDRDAAAGAVSVAVLGYLAAATLNRPWVGWVTLPLAGLIIAAGKLFDVEPWLWLGVAAAVLGVVGALGRGSRGAVTAQIGAVLVYGGLAVLGLMIDPRLGGILAALTLIGHAAWDVVHYRRNQVVPRSLAEACIFLDVSLGLAVLFLTLLGSG